MLDRSGNDMLAFRSGFERGMKSGVIRFRAATGENDLARLATEEGGNLFARSLDGIAHLRSEPVTARRIGEIFFQIWSHCFQHRRIDCRRRVIIEISDFIRRDHAGTNGISLIHRCKPAVGRCRVSAECQRRDL